MLKQKKLIIQIMEMKLLMNKKKPARRCMGCNESKEKNELIRIVKSKEGIIEIDLVFDESQELPQWSINGN